MVNLARGHVQAVRRSTDAYDRSMLWGARVKHRLFRGFDSIPSLSTFVPSKPRDCRGGSTRP